MPQPAQFRYRYKFLLVELNPAAPGALSRGAATACSPRRKPWVGSELQTAEPRSGGSNRRPAVAASRLDIVRIIYDLRADARSYMLTSLRDYRQCG